MIRFLFLLSASVIAGLAWDVGSELGLIFNIVLRPVGLAIIVILLWPVAQLKSKIGIIFGAVVASNVIETLMYALQAGPWCVTSDVETQLWMLISFIIQTVVSLTVLIVEDRIITKRTLNNSSDMMSQEHLSTGTDKGLTTAVPVAEDKTAGRVLRPPTIWKRLEAAFGPILAGMLIDGIDFISIGPFGHIMGFFLAGAAAYWMCSYSGLPRGQCIAWSLLAAVYCLIPMMRYVPLATLVGAYLRFRDPQGGAVQTPAVRTVSEEKQKDADDKNKRKGE